MGILDVLLGRPTLRSAVRRPRAGVRVPIEENATLRRLGAAGSQLVILQNLSQCGARIATPARLATREEVTLTIDAGKHQPFEIGCKIVTAQRKPGKLHYEYGMQFTAVHPGEIERLRRFVQSRDDARKSGASFI